MDTRAMLFFVLLVFTEVTSLVKADPTDNTTTLPALTTAPQNSLKSTSTVKSSPKNSVISTEQTKSSGAVTQAPASSTTPAPLNCIIGVCNGTNLNTTGCNTVVSRSKNTCTSGESCAVVQTNLNDTYSSFNFSCAADCSALVKEGRKVACCSTSNCTPDISKPIQKNGGVAATPFYVVSFFTLILMSVLVM